MLIAVHGVKLYDHNYTRSEALCSFARHGVKLYALSYRCSDAVCS